MLIYLIFGFFVSAPAFSATLGEMGTAAGIAGELNKNAVKIQSKDILEKTRENVRAYERAQRRGLDNVSDEDFEEEDDLRPTGKSKFNRETFQHIRPMDYNSSIQVFYKKECLSNRKDCDRGPVLTNIKSVIFDYARAQGHFSEESAN